MGTDSLVLSKLQLLDLKKSYIKLKAIPVTTLKEDFPHIFKSLEDANGVSDYRVICCDTLSIWFLRATQVVHLDSCVKIDFVELLDRATCGFLFEYVIDFWNESGAPLGSSLKEMFVKFIAFLNSLGDNSKLYQEWLLHVLNNLPFTLRVLYFIVETLCNQIPGSSSFILKNYSNFIKTSISYMWSNALANPVGKALQVVFKNYYKEIDGDDIKWLQSWDRFIIENMKKDSLRKNIQNYLLPYLFKVSTTAFKNFVKNLVDSDEEDELSIMLISLRIGQELGIVDEAFEGPDKIVSVELLSELMSSDKEFFRIESFSLLTLSPRGSKPISPVVLDLVLDKLDVYLTDVDLEVRNEFVSLFKKFILRLRDSIYAINRNSQKMISKNKFLEEANEGLARVERNKTFLEKLIGHLMENMKPGVSFQRCNMSLKLLTILIRSGLDNTVNKQFYEKLHMDYPFSIEIYRDPKIVRLLVDNITNDFEEVRDLSINILSMSSLSVDELMTIKQLDLIASRSFEMLGDLKGRRADAGAKVLQFMFNNGSDNLAILNKIVDKLANCISFAKSDFTLAVYEENIHGYYLALNAILKGLETDKTSHHHQILQKIVRSILDVWILTKPVLTHDSPEGNLPDEMQQALEPSKKHLETKFGPATQVILSYSWRSVKESATLLTTILSKFSDEELFQDNDIQLKDIGELLIDQLSTIRHPGAFSSVYPTFLACCNRCFRLGHVELPELWLLKNLSLIEDKSHSITRRSGGLPFLITAILTAEYQHSRKSQKKKQIPHLFEITFERLYNIAVQPFDDSTGEETLELPQVHALNSIKSLFVESLLSDLSNHYVDRSLDLALSKFSSKHWSMRNASVMLFTALQNRLFGTKKIDNNHLSTISARLFFSRYRKLQPVLLKNFEIALNDEDEVENLFPILTILSRLHSTTGFNPILEFKPLLLKSSKNKFWKVREMAARAIPSVVDDDLFYSQIEELIQSMNFNDNNEVHGFLLAIKELLVRIQIRTGHEDEGIPISVTNFIFQILNKVLLSTYFSAITYIEILEIVIEGSCSYSNVPETLVNKLGNYYIEKNELTELDGGKQLFLSRLSTLLFKIYDAKEDHTSLNDLLKLGLYSGLYECQLASINYISCHVGTFTFNNRAEFIEILWLILESNVWSYVKAAALILLKNLLIANDYNDIQLKEKTQILFKFIQDPSDDVKSTALECLGPFVAKMNDTDLFNKWINLINRFSKDEMSYHLRFSSMKSCISYIQVEHNNKSKQLVLALLKLHQFLYDDDDEIRELTSTFISRNLMNLRFNLVSVEAEKRFLNYLGESIEPALLQDIIFNIFVEKLSGLNIEIVDESSLFNVEKNNFYKNIVDELNFYISLLPLVSVVQRNVILNLMEKHLLILDKLLMLEDDILGIFKNEDFFNFAFIVLLVVKSFSLETTMSLKISLKSGIHPFLQSVSV